MRSAQQRFIREDATYNRLKASVTALRLDLIESWDNDGVVADVREFERRKARLDKAEAALRNFILYPDRKRR